MKAQVTKIRLSRGEFLVVCLIGLSLGLPWAQAETTPLQLAQHWSPVLYQDVDTKWENLQAKWDHHITVNPAKLALFLLSPQAYLNDWLPAYLDKDNSGQNENGIDDFISAYGNRYDGDLNLANNWESLTNHESGGVLAYVYYTVSETNTHWYIYYAVYHPRDWDNEKSVQSGHAHNQHVNDMEAILYIVKKDGSDQGQLEAVCTMAHNKWLNYPINTSIKSGSKGHESHITGGTPLAPLSSFGHNLTGGPNRHYRFYIESEGHGIYMDAFDFKFGEIPVDQFSLDSIDPEAKIARWAAGDGSATFPNGTGVIYYNSVDNSAGLAQPIPAIVQQDANDNDQLEIIQTTNRATQYVGYQLISQTTMDKAES